MLSPRPTVEQVRAVRDKTECGIEEAKAAIRLEWRNDNLRRLRSQAGEAYTVESCREVIADLIDLLLED